MDESSSLYIGTTALSAGDYVHQALRYADTIIMSKKALEIVHEWLGGVNNG